MGEQTPKAMQGTWSLVSPDGREWFADSPIKCVAAEQRERVPAHVAMARILDAAAEPTDGQMLDWLEAQWVGGVHVEACAKGDGTTWHGNRPACTVFVGATEHRADNLRSAIRAAMNQGGAALEGMTP